MKNTKYLLENAVHALNSKPVYLGIFVNKQELLKVVQAKFPNIFCDHCTLAFNPKSDQIQLFEEFIGKQIKIELLEEFSDEKGQAVSCHLFGIPNALMPANPHITISTQTGVKPVYSNELLKKQHGTRFQNTLTLNGSCDTFPRSLKI